MLACIASTRSVHAHHHMVGLTTSGRLWYNGGYTSLPTPLLRHHMLANQTDLSYLAHTAASDSSCTIPSLHAATLQSIHKSVCPPPQATSRFLSCFILASTSSTRATFCVIVVLLLPRMASLVCCQALLSSSAISRTASLSRSSSALSVTSWALMASRSFCRAVIPGKMRKTMKDKTRISVAKEPKQMSPMTCQRISLTRFSSAFSCSPASAASADGAGT
mmetsp:Transcript_36110/g.103721  ORF Transcript_36110/g.103721 Transcript_36110/m.103721 type:complete len:220 (-) Transcript_36110:115-774(-)